MNNELPADNFNTVFFFLLVKVHQNFLLKENDTYSFIKIFRCGLVTIKFHKAIKLKYI